MSNEAKDFIHVPRGWTLDIIFVNVFFVEKGVFFCFCMA